MRLVLCGANYRVQLEPGDIIERDGARERAAQAHGVTKTLARHELSALLAVLRPDVDSGSSSTQAA